MARPAHTSSLSPVRGRNHGVTTKTGLWIPPPAHPG
jgi:hypothetical protein